MSPVVTPCPSWDNCWDCASKLCTYFETSNGTKGCVYHDDDVDFEVDVFVEPGEQVHCPREVEPVVVFESGWNWTSFMIGLIVVSLIVVGVVAWKRYKQRLSSFRLPVFRLRRAAATESAVEMTQANAEDTLTETAL